MKPCPCGGLGPTCTEDHQDLEVPGLGAGEISLGGDFEAPEVVVTLRVVDRASGQLRLAAENGAKLLLTFDPEETK